MPHDVFISYGSEDSRRGERNGEKPKDLVIHRSGELRTVQVAPGMLQTKVEDRVIPETESRPHLSEKRP
jgi:hypothetical protein